MLTKRCVKWLYEANILKNLSMLVNYICMLLVVSLIFLYGAILTSPSL